MAKRTRATATTSTLARVNQTAIIEALRESGALSRQQLGVKTGLSPATINRLTASLIDDGLIVPAGQEPSTGGRPSVLLRYAGSSRLVAAIQLRAETVTGILVDFDGKVVFRRSVTLGARQAGAEGGGPDGDGADGGGTGAAPDQDRQLRKVFRLFDDLIATADSMGTPCLAVGIAVPGVVQQPDGVVGTMPEFGWTGVPFGALLRERTDLPVIVENDANALAYGELHAGAGRGLSSLVALFLENGLGAGIVANGELHRGARAEAGEIGYLLMERSSLERSYDARGDLEDRIGSLALTQRARERGMPIPASGSLTAEDVFELARTGNTDAQELADEILDMVAIAVAALVIVLDPELVVVGSSFVGSSDMVIPGIQERLRGRIIRVPRIEPATHREDAVLLGAAELAAAEVNGFAYLAF
ncbi:ROK family transcriptional regulator [Leifsonia shinshuensis]|uniref:ROK family transcriptional regulator n=1 Tax=Leifsonia shinshuensis TaxID=150026 RepID=UPI002861F228|nr:ROK family transcriptional regulator [Leifsonia shinshuensis]MDR6971713.1 putative NBD/HSP70 family sugar kinase [Leifsonia shinshuensis]